MKIKFKRVVEADAAEVLIIAKVRYAEDIEPLPMPKFTGEDDGELRMLIDIATGQILKWDNPSGASYSVHAKVCDSGEYFLFEKDESRPLISHDGYVPGWMPGDHHQDYIILDISPEGRITNWREPKDFARRLQQWAEAVTR